MVDCRSPMTLNSRVFRFKSKEEIRLSMIMDALIDGRQVSHLFRDQPEFVGDACINISNRCTMDCWPDVCNLEYEVSAGWVSYGSKIRLQAKILNRPGALTPTLSLKLIYKQVVMGHCKEPIEQ